MKKTAILILLLMSAVFAREVPLLSIDFTFVPDTIYPVERTMGVFTITNPQGARPVFNLNITFWTPCGDDTHHDFLDVTEWNVNDASWKNTRIIFSGVKERRVVWSTKGPSQQYAQCLYSFVFQLPPKSDNFRGPAVIRPGETINLNFTLQSGQHARPGTYDEEIVNQDYMLPGKELATIIKE